MARIQGLTGRRAGVTARVLYFFAKRKVGRVPEPATILAHHPRMMRGWAAFEVALDGAAKVDPRLKMLASLKAAALIGCPF